MNTNGFYNEIDFINGLNNKHIYELSGPLIEMLKKLYGNISNNKEIILCKKSFKTDKTDIIININGIKKYISIKSDKNNSMHLESITEFNNFLKENNISKELINIYNNYHYAIENNRNRLSAKEYQETHQVEINILNSKINEPKILKKAIERFIFKGTHNYNNPVDAIIYGKINNFVCLTKNEIIEYLIKQNDTFNAIHFSSLVLQPWTRNLNYNPKYENRRNYVQVKWYRLEETIDKILNKEK